MYQSAYFTEHFPEDNDRFSDVVVTSAVPGDRENSLRVMREEMIESEPFGAGVFVGGMEGVEHEFEMFRSRHPDAGLFPVASTGAAARLVFNSISRLATSRVYGALFEELLYPRRAAPKRRRPEPPTPKMKRATKKPGRR
jgi:hypothetical protein